MKKLGPGSDADTLKVLAMLPEDSFQVIVDAGCGIGRQTLALARRLNATVHAVDLSAAHLDCLAQRAKELGIGHLVQTHCMDMADIPATFAPIDLLWSECAAYHIGFANALKAWFPAIRAGGYAVVSELSWLRDDVPDEAREYLLASYPGIRDVDRNRAIAQAAGYQVVATHVLSKAAWIEDYYEKLAPLARSLLNHDEKPVRDFAAETLKGIWIFDCFGDSYGYVFYVLKKQ
ncbi:MAG: class I SAM-dependent methyltransferase [Desulfobulbus sp.]|nr:class I SAM-dependent methyltransferase [Desulfobulbus sp.]